MAAISRGSESQLRARPNDMSRANVVQTNFTSGEVSPHLYGRVDINKYFNGARKLRNMIVMPQGGAFRRPGTLFTAETKTSSKRSIIRPFKFSEAQPYVLEFGDQYVRFYYNGARLEVASTPVEVATPYLEADLPLLKFTQSADVLYIMHPSYAPRILSRVTHTSWMLAAYATVDGPYMDGGRAEKLTVTLVTDTATAVASTAIFTVPTLKVITGTGTAGSAVFITSVAHGFSTGNTVVIAGVLGTVEANGTWVITVTGANTFTLIGSVYVNAYVSGGTAQLNVTGTFVPYRENNTWKLSSILSIQSTTVALVDVTDTTIQPEIETKITYASGGITATTPTFSIYDVNRYIRTTDTGVWYKITSVDDSELARGTAVTVVAYTYPTTTVTVSNRSIFGNVVSDTNLFASTDVGRFLRLEYFGTWVLCTTQTYTDAKHVFVKMQSVLPTDPTNVTRPSNDGTATDWRFGAFSVTSGYPSVVAFHQGRLVFASTTAQPLTLWFSESGDYASFVPSDPKTSEVTDSNAITITLVSKEANQIRWLDSGPVLLVGTEGNEWQVKPSSITQSLTPTNVIATIQTSFGSVNTDQSVKVGSQTIFIQRGGRKLRELTYDFSVDAFVAKELSIISEHIPRLRGGLVEMTLQKVPHNILWIVSGDGTLVGVTYEREHEVVGWHIHELGGSGVVESACCIPSIDGKYDDLYLVVKRTINAATKRYVEQLGRLPDPLSYSDLSSGYWVDCGIVLDNVTPTNTATVTGLSHLNAATVQRVVDGIFVGTGTPSAGSVTLNYRATKVHVGFGYEGVIGILEPEGGSQAGTSQSKKKRVNEAAARVENSLHFKTASSAGRTNNYMSLSSADDPLVTDRNRIIPGPVINTPGTGVLPTFDSVRLETGDITFAVDDNYDNGGRFELVQDEPYPMNVLALMPKLNTNE